MQRFGTGCSKIKTSFVSGFATVATISFHMHFLGNVDFLLILPCLTNFCKNITGVVLYFLINRIYCPVSFY